MGKRSDGGFDIDSFLKKSLAAAVNADSLSSIIDKKNENMLVTAFFQTIGTFIMYGNMRSHSPITEQTIRLST
jgi:hypothetical protein